MFATFTSGPVLWYANRATGVVLMVLLTASTALGMYSTARAGSVHWPRFATQTLHRNVSILACLMLFLHIASAVVDTYVNIRWWDALVPFLGKYQSWWLGLGAVANNLMIAVMVTSLVRERLHHRLWRIVHLLSYAAWAIGVGHGIGIGTDISTAWGMSISAVSIGVVATFGIIRLATLAHERRLAA